MRASLLRHRRGIVGAIAALYSIAGAWQYAHARHTELSPLPTFAWLAPPFLALGIGAGGLIAVITARRGEPLDQRPKHAALTGVALLWLGVFMMLLGFGASAFASSVAGIVFLVGALADWGKLFALLRSYGVSEHRGEDVPPVVGGIPSPVLLVAPKLAAYRESAKGAPIAAVPLDRSLASNRLTMQIAIAIACAFLALPAGAAAAVPIVKQERARLAIAGSSWRGEISSANERYPFTLDIESADNGHFRGVMDWGTVAANVEGTYERDRLVFYDRSIRRTNGAPFTLNDRKEVRLAGDEMIGTDRGGQAPLRALRIR